ncbi:class I adenylate-forming enzyme family protein [Stappia sp.]|uniref:class I adenylate-forming enzyme family protein n=1 Tax=Stappia sp. TaxID=1870903 RepID=UPI0032D8D039
MSPAAVTRIHQMVDGHAEATPQRLAVIDADGTQVTYAAYRDATRAAADTLRAAGVRAGDRVLIVAENCFTLAALILACSRLDAWAIPVNARMTAAEIGRVAAHATPRVTAFTTAVSPEARAHAEAAGAQVHETGFGAVALAGDETARPEPVRADADQVAVLLYTTGTTGAPKGVMLTHANLCFAAEASADLRDLTAQDRVYGALPLTHVFGLASMLMASAHAGACVQLETRFSPERLLAALRDGATAFPAVPQMHALLMKHTADLGMTRLEGAKLRYVSSGAAPLDPAWKRKAEAFYGLALQNGYGMTETTAGICGTRNPPGTPDVSVGKPLKGVEVRIDAPDHEGVGEILTRGPHVMTGYYRNPVETARVLDAAGWLRTGDMGRFDEDGNVHVVGRCKELIIRSGFNVYPPEVEAALTEHPGVVQAAVVGRRVEGGNEEVMAFVQGSDALLDEEALKRFVGERLASYKCPSRIVLVDRLPAAPSGKILKTRLLDTFADRLDPAEAPRS